VVAERLYTPDFSAECHVCGSSPCVIVEGHEHQPHTELCGRHFFDDRRMIDYELWNEPVEDTE
jgi:hypothetical protein